MLKSISRRLKYIIALIILFPVINFYIPTTNLPDEFKIVIQELNKKNPDDLEFIEAVYIDISQRFTSENKCWKNYYTRNYLISGKSIWKLQGECLPCHIQNNLLQSALLESRRFKREEIRTKTVICTGMFHIYSQIILKNGTIIDVDQWSAGWDKPFGEVGVCKQ